MNNLTTSGLGRELEILGTKGVFPVLQSLGSRPVPLSAGCRDRHLTQREFGKLQRSAGAGCFSHLPTWGF